jgi:transglutaminase-like putative cysteine protease
VEQDFTVYLRPTRYLDADHPEVVAFARDACRNAADPRERAVRLFYAVRDRIRYDPYAAVASPESYKASVTVQRGASFCVPKAILLAAVARCVGIPARLRFADVRNHLATPRLLNLLRSDRFVFHGLTEVQLDGGWLKATPTFNLSLCEKFGVRPLEFDGLSDAVLHPYDRDGKRHMEYLRDRGSFADLPFDELLRAYRGAYPHLFDEGGRFLGLAPSPGDFEDEVSVDPV